jgi:hypothetical protein
MATNAGAQAASSRKIPTRLLAAALEYRWITAGGGIPLDACSVYQAMATPGDYPNAFSRSVREQFDRPVSRPCGPVHEDTVAIRMDSVSPPVMGVRVRDWIRVDSAVRHDSTARVFLSVKRAGDAYHHEEIDAVRGPMDERWRVLQIRIWGLLYAVGGF